VHPLLRTALIAFLVCAGYYVGGIVSLLARFESSGIAIIWLPKAFLLARRGVGHPLQGHFDLLRFVVR
jgi:hypothetical protein